jgi:hypothetical protein
MAIEGLKKHAGQLSNTGVRVAVVFRKIPNDENHCLIVETERLPDGYHDYVIQCLNSKEALETNEFYEVLNRRTFHDGMNCLTALHQKGFLRKEPVSNITMYPLPGQAVPLALINATIDKKLDQYKANEAAKVIPPPVEDTRTPAEKQAAAEALAARMMGEVPVEAPASTPTPTPTVDHTARAKMLISQAEAMEDNAWAKREEAYALAPELRPGRGRPPTPEEEVAAKMEERKAKRRERDQRKAAEAKVEKKEAALDAKVQAKIQRDIARAEQA